MISLSALNLKKHSLQRRLFITMLVLSGLLLALFFLGLFLVLGYSDTKGRISKKLDFQLDIFARETTSYYKELAAMGLLLSEESGRIVDKYLSENQISFKNLQDSQKNIRDIEKRLFAPLRQKLFEANCTGAFIMLQTSVNSKSEHADTSRSGLYLQKSSLDASDGGILLYRGPSDLGKQLGYMPHRRWRLEFDTDLFPDYDELIKNAALPLISNFCITDIFTLPGTSEKIMLLVVPLMSDTGQIFGLCGLEVNQSYFKQAFAQASSLDRATFCLSKGKKSFKNMEDCFTAGIVGGYYSAPEGNYSIKAFGNGLDIYRADKSLSYIGAAKEVKVFPNNFDFTLRVLMPKTDYDHLVLTNIMRVLFLIALFSFLAAALCIYFSFRYLTPLKKSINDIRKRTYAINRSEIREIDDLFVFLDEENRANEEMLESMEEEKRRAQKALKEMQSQYDEINKKIERLAYSRKNEIDPDDYENFKIGFKLLTKREKEILDLYIAGKGVKEIMEEADLKESTVRFHNRNIYSKLGVHSLKQLLRCIAIMEEEKKP